MKRGAFAGLVVCLLLSGAAAAQTREGYLDVLVVKVRPEKRSEFEAVVKKMVDANRRFKGDGWVTSETAWGEMHTVSFISPRQSYAELEKAYELFMGAMNKAFGSAGVSKVFQEFNNCIVSDQGVLRRRRWDLSANAPADSEAMARLVGESRWVRTTVVQVRPGQVLSFEAQLKAIKEAAERNTARPTTLVSQAVAGQQGTVFYISSLQRTLGGFDAVPTLPQMLGDQGYQAFLRNVAETVQGSETIISRFAPELSNPPGDIASAAPEFWKPKPVAAKPKTGSTEAVKPAAQEKQ